MPLFEIAITTHEGEREYTEKEQISAKDLDQAVEHAKEKLSEYFGDEEGQTIPDGDLVWDSFQEVAAEIEWVSESHELTYIYNVETGENEPWMLVPAVGDERFDRKTWKPWMDKKETNDGE
jgi:hypothetical protein